MRSSTTTRPVLAALCCTVMFLYAVYLGAVGVLLPFLGTTFRLGAEAQGRLFPTNFAGFVVGVLLCGYLSDRWGRKAVLLIGITGYAAGLALFGVAQSFGVALAASALVGAGSGAMEVVACALATDIYPERRAVLLNAIQVAFGVGAALSPSVASTLLAHGTDWRTLYFGLAAINAIVFFFLASCRVARTETHEAVELSTLKAVLRKPAFGLLCLAQALYVGGEVSYFSWMPTYFQQQLPGGAAWMGIVGTLFWTSMSIGRFVTGGLLRFSLLQTTMFMAFGGALAAVLTLLGTTPLIVAGCVCLAGLCFSGIFSLILAEAGDRFPSIAGTVFGGVVAAGGVGGAVVPWVVGALAGTGLGWRGALLLIPLALFGVGAISLALKRTVTGGDGGAVSPRS